MHLVHLSLDKMQVNWSFCKDESVIDRWTKCFYSTSEAVSDLVGDSVEITMTDQSRKHIIEIKEWNTGPLRLESNAPATFQRSSAWMKA